VISVQIILETVWYCRLLAKGEDADRISDDVIKKKGEDVCGTPSTAANGLPACADVGKQRLLNILQLFPISRMVKRERIKMVRASGGLSRESWSLFEISNPSTPLNSWECRSGVLSSLVSTDCAYFATAHAAYYYRQHSRVCHSILTILVQRYLPFSSQATFPERFKGFKQKHTI
jgi:hypothetical protein